MSSLSSTLSGVAGVVSLGSMAPPPFGTIASLAGSAISIGSKLAGNKEAKDEATKQRELEEEADDKARAVQDKQDKVARSDAAMALAPDQANAQWFKMGNNGKTGFEIAPKEIVSRHNPLSREGYRIQGGSHAEGGVTDLNGNVAEGNETVYKQRVYSNRMSPSGLSYSDEAAGILKERSALETENEETIDTHKQNTNERYLEITDERLTRLFQTQGTM